MPPPAFGSKEIDWTRAALERAGFRGWLTFAQLSEQPQALPAAGGVYVVAGSGSNPKFLRANPGGRFKGRDPSVSPDALRSNWVDRAEVVYIGKADDLRRRLREYRQFGEGRPVGHWGGRLIWQLVDSDRLVVAWKVTEDAVPREVESTMIHAFRGTFGKPPFANDPHRLGR